MNILINLYIKCSSYETELILTLGNYLEKKRREDKHKFSLTEDNTTRNFQINNLGARWHPWLEVDIHWLYYTCPSETLWKLLLLRVNPSFLPTASTSLIGSTPGLSTRNTRSQGQSPHRRSQKQYTWIPAALQHTVYSKKITANTNYFIPVHCAVWCRLFCKWETEISCA